MAERQLPKLHTRVRFPSPAPIPKTRRQAGFPLRVKGSEPWGFDQRGPQGGAQDAAAQPRRSRARRGIGPAKRRADIPFTRSNSENPPPGGFSIAGEGKRTLGVRPARPAGRRAGRCGAAAAVPSTERDRTGETPGRHSLHPLQFRKPAARRVFLCGRREANPGCPCGRVSAQAPLPGFPGKTLILLKL